MQAILSLASYFSTLTTNIGSFLINHILQSIFFTIFITNIIVVLLKFIGFAYTSFVEQSTLIQIFGLIAMWYFKIWDYYTGILYILSVLSLSMVSIYVYDCCGNISERFDNWKTNNRDWAVISSYTFMFVSTAFVFYSIHASHQQSHKYQYSGIYFLMVFIILLGNMIRGRSVIYTLIGILTMNYLVATRYLIRLSAQDTIFAQIPFAVIPYLMMALHAQNKQRQNCKSQLLTKLFMAGTALSAYSLLNDNKFPLELVLGGVFIFGIIINR